MESLPWELTSDQLAAFERRCTGCDAPLVTSARMLELDQRDGAFHDRRDVQEGRSHGWFPFCLGCAAREIEKATAPRPDPYRTQHLASKADRLESHRI